MPPGKTKKRKREADSNSALHPKKGVKFNPKFGETSANSALSATTVTTSGGRVRYTMDEDSALTQKQAEKGAFKSESDFRYKSNWVRSGDYRTGYHESYITTDAFNYLSGAIPVNGDQYELPEAKNSSSSFFAKYKGDLVPKSVLDKMLKVCDTFRTDTARTVLSAREGRAAGHSGSKLRLTGQKDAHDLLRQSIMDVLKVDPNSEEGKGISEKSC